MFSAAKRPGSFHTGLRHSLIWSRIRERLLSALLARMERGIRARLVLLADIHVGLALCRGALPGAAFWRDRVARPFVELPFVIRAAVARYAPSIEIVGR